MSTNALEMQVAGSHYKNFVIQPVEFCQKNELGFCESSAIKYLCRWQEKGGLVDLKKAIHFIQMLQEMNKDFVVPTK